MLKYGVEVWKLQNRQMESVLSRMQKMAVEYNEKIETVNRERKFHQVIILLLLLFLTTAYFTAKLIICVLISKTLVVNSMP
jgi:hypothetical protein